MMFILMMLVLGQDAGREWIDLFNGRDLEGWQAKIAGHEPGDNFGNTFRVEDGLLKVSYDGYEQFEGRFGHLFYKQPFSHYVLRLEYRFVGEQIPGGPGWGLQNSGVMIHGQSAESMEKDQEFPVSIEVQLLGDVGDGRGTGNLCTPGTHVVMDGELITKHCTFTSFPAYSGERWVTVEVEVHGSDRIIHRVEGETVLEYTDTQYDPDDEYGRKFIRDGNKTLSGGTISLQSESHPIHFRKIQLRPIRK